MTSQSVLVRFVCLRATGSTAGGNCSRCTGREQGRAGLCVSRTDADGRHEIPRHDRACRVTTPRNMNTRTASKMQVRGMLRHAPPRCECTSPRTFEAQSSMLCFVLLRSPMCVRRSLESTANGSTGRRGKSMLCIRFETLAVDVASSCSRPTV